MRAIKKINLIYKSNELLASKAEKKILAFIKKSNNQQVNNEVSFKIEEINALINHSKYLKIHLKESLNFL